MYTQTSTHAYSPTEVPTYVHTQHEIQQRAQLSISRLLLVRSGIYCSFKHLLCVFVCQEYSSLCVSCVRLWSVSAGQE